MIYYLFLLYLSYLFSIIIAVILYDYNINYRVHKVLQHIIEVSAIIVTIGILIACISSINDNIHKYIRHIPIVTPIVLPVR